MCRKKEKCIHQVRRSHYPWVLVPFAMGKIPMEMCIVVVVRSRDNLCIADHALYGFDLTVNLIVIQTIIKKKNEFNEQPTQLD